ncbi:hypothetical protein LZC95_08355 [Pendulispora brunnea]|uniref:Uncharacterized protein n=1 Tax=Pendulispora brunnea TaxID=2905690 RepID=A0ABZ2KH23_9BACT
MDLIASLSARLRPTDAHARIALAAELADRVFPLYQEYWTGTYSEEVRRSIELVWARACDEPVDDHELQACLKEVRETNSYYLDEGIDVLANAVTVVLRAIEAVVASEDDSILAVARALTTAIDAAVAAEAMANQESSNDQQKELAEAEEESWQERALALVDGWKGVARRDMFASLGGKPPAWLDDWKVRTANVR